MTLLDECGALLDPVLCASIDGGLLDSRPVHLISLASVVRSIKSDIN